MSSERFASLKCSDLWELNIELLMMSSLVREHLNKLAVLAILTCEHSSSLFVIG